MEVVFIPGPKHMCDIQPFSLAGLDGEVILVRWGKNGRVYPEKVYNISVKRGKVLG